MDFSKRISQGRLSVILRQCRLRMSSTSGAEDDVVFQKINSTGIITLNRPKALNAISLSMVKKITPKLREWCDDSSTSLVIMKGAGGKAFCAGGDIKALADSGKAGDPLARNFFRNKYSLNHIIGTMKKPYVALIHGISVGGALGLFVHGKYRVATEKTVFGLPETAIGMLLDVGGGNFLHQLDGKLGIYLALTGYRLKGRDVLHSGAATHFVEAPKLPELEQELCSLQSPQHAEVQEVLQKFHQQCTIDADKPFSLAPHKPSIDKLFHADTVEAIFQNLEQDGSEWATKQLEILKKMSPTSMKITLRQVLEGAKLTLSDYLTMDYRVAKRIMRGHDFYEGVRALLIDRDNDAKWSPATLEGVDENIVTSHFSPLADEEELVL